MIWKKKKVFIDGNRAKFYFDAQNWRNQNP